jgi:cytidylate kinase
VPEVRARLLELQRDIIGDGGIVVEGRDIGSVVAPDAAGEGLPDRRPRCPRRPPRPEEGGTDVAAVEASLLARDKIDSGRATAPLTMPEGAVHIDTTPYSLDEVIDQVVALVEAVARS